MNEITTIVSVVVIACAVFGAMWLIIQDVKRGVHARIERCENVIDTVVVECSKKKEDFITTKAFDRFESNLTVRFNGFGDSIKHLTSRIDDLVIATRSDGAN